MYFEQFYLGCLAHASYMLASEGDAIVIDPQRDVEIYLTAAAEHDLKIRHIFETHLHADFSGHKELAERTGATIYIGPHGGARFTRTEVGDGFQLRVGKMRLDVLNTPGHTPESICMVVTDEEKSEQPWAVFTGDTLFIGDVGRPDLSQSHTPAELAGHLYESLHNKLMKLPGDVLVFPAHGAGSLCGRNMRAERSSTIATERMTNYALQIGSREEFIRELTSKVPVRPDYFLQDAEINRDGAAPLSELKELKPLSPQALKSLLDDGILALDVRPPSDFAKGHVSGSINIALSGQFASWAGSVLGLSSRPVMIADNDDQLSEARLRLARVGIEDARGFLEGGIAGWEQAGMPAATLQEASVDQVHAWLRSGDADLFDVRRESEWKAAHIEGAAWLPLDSLNQNLPMLPKDRRIAVHCKSGYRSAIACSVLQRAGFQNVVNVLGGIDAWQAASLPTISEETVKV
jgi:rhodanese-related sulfurtransferase/glyoxylase-like metal-dependent hydrolase (beta-lactamase superfamily II)